MTWRNYFRQRYQFSSWHVQSQFQLLSTRLEKDISINTFFYIFIFHLHFSFEIHLKSLSNSYQTKCILIQKYGSKNYLRISYNTTVSQNFILLIFASRLIYLPSVFVFISYSDCNFIHMCLRIQCVCFNHKCFVDDGMVSKVIKYYRDEKCTPEI